MGKSRKHSRVLLVTAKDDLTTDLLVVELQKRGSPYLRLNCEDFPLELGMSWRSSDQGGGLNINGRKVLFSQFKSAWFRRPTPSNLPNIIRPRTSRTFVLHETGTFLEGIWETSPWLWVNKPSKVRLAENKICQLSLATRVGLPIPKTLISNDPQSVRTFAKSSNPIVAKSLSGKSISSKRNSWGLFTRTISLRNLQKDMEIQISPCIFQEQILKAFDLRVTIVGAQQFVTKIETTAQGKVEVDWRLAEPSSVRYSNWEPPTSLIEHCYQMMQHLGLIYAAIDFVVSTSGQYYFLEINPSGQWGWIENATGGKITATLVDLLIKGGA